MLLLTRMRNHPSNHSLRTVYSVSKRSPSPVSYQLPRALSVLHPQVQEVDSNGKELESGDFSKFRLSQETVELLKAKNITHLFPIQSETFDFIYNGEDVMAQARTGTGKTLSFILPLIEKLKLENRSESYRQAPKVLVLAPTRELCKQIGGEFDYFKSGLKVGCFYGGVPVGPQADAIERGLDIVVGTPGRLMDHVVNGSLNLRELRYVVIDEVDRMLDMGFSDVVDDILQESYSYGEKPQALLYSATLPSWVHNTAKKYMSEDKKVVDLIGTQSLKAAETVQHLAVQANKDNLASVISDVVQVYCGAHSRTLIFTETRNEASYLGLNSVLKQDAQVLHGDINQEQREITLRSFREGKVRCLVATDVAARGLDIPEVDLVVLTQPPKDLDMYIHRSGRTGRAGRNGVSVVIHGPGQLAQLRAVEKSTGIKFKRITPPSADDIIKASASDAERFIEEISPDVVEKFRDFAQALVEKLGAVEALAAALAHISNTKEIKSRSLITGEEGFITYLLKSRLEMSGTGFIWKALETFPEIKRHVRNMRLCQDSMGVVMDVPDHLEDLMGVENLLKERRISAVEKISELPELRQRPQRSDTRDTRSIRSYGEMDRRFGAKTGGFRERRESYGGRQSFRRSSEFGRTSEVLKRWQ